MWGAVNPIDTVARGAEIVVRPLGLTEDEPGSGQWPAVAGTIVFLFALGVGWTVRVTGLMFQVAWRAFTPSLVPIVFGYAVAHYFQLFADNIQAFVFRLSDPLGRGWDLFGGADGLIWQIDPDAVAWIQVVAMLLGHVGAVAAAHDRAVELFPPAVCLPSQFGMFAVMVAYSSLGLWLLLTA